jgi:hypothetical protein
MNELPRSPASAPSSTEPTDPPKRRWTFLGRLAQAVREQNWFAVVLEVCIVIVGVVIGFQVTAWGQSRADRAQEQVYLHQLVADLDETLRVIAQEDSVREAVATPALLAVLGSWGSGTPLPADSIVRISRQILTARTLLPTTGTAEALVATGDLTLIRNDSLRNAITAYLGATETLVSFQVRVAEEMNDASEIYLAAVGSNRIAAVDLGMDLFQRSISQSKTLTDSGWVPPFPLDATTFYASQEAYDALSKMAIHRQGFENIAEAMAQQARDLRQKILAELDR